MNISKRTLIIIVITLVVLVLLGVYHDRRTVWGSNDFDTYYFAARLVLSGDNLYTHEAFRTTLSPYLYLPFFAVLISPLALLPIRAAAFFWYIFNIAALIGSCYFSMRLLMTREEIIGWFRKRPDLTAIASAILVIAIWADNVSLAQVDFMIFFLVVLSFYLYQEKRPYLSGILLAMTAVIKIYPFYILFYFLAKRRYKAVAGAAAGILLFLAIVPCAAMGRADFKASMKSWYQIRVLPQINVKGKTVKENFAHYEAQLKPKNQALSAVTTRYFLKDDETVMRFKRDDYEYRIYWPHPLSPTQVEMLIKILLLMIAGMTFLKLDYRNKRGSGTRQSLEYSAVLLSMLLLFPMVKSHTFAPVILPVIAFNYLNINTRMITRFIKYLFLAGIAVYALQADEYMQVLGAGCIAILIWWGIFVKLLGNHGRDLA